MLRTFVHIWSYNFIDLQEFEDFYSLKVTNYNSKNESQNMVIRQ